MINQDEAPLYAALTDYIRQGNVPLHVPGHKQGQGLPAELKEMLGPAMFCCDLTEVPGLDDLHQPAGPLKKAQELAAELFHAEASFLLVNGTTCGLQAAVLATSRLGDRVLIPRHAHRAVTGALVLSGALPVYLKPQVDKVFGVPVGIMTSAIEQAVKETDRLKAVLHVHPTYHGFVSDIRAVTDICHQQGIPVLVDEAHGAHFAFHPELPPTAMDAGADISVQSTHKTLGALTQGSMLHIKSALINHNDIARNLRLLQTTSPSYIVMLSLDLARRQMAEQGRALMTDVLEMARWTREQVAELKCLKCAGPETCTGIVVDPTKILINVAETGLTGYAAAAILREEHHVQVELADTLNILAVLTIGTTMHDCRSFVAALQKITEKYQSAASRQDAKSSAILYDCPLPPVEMTPREAWFAPARSVRIEAARDCIAAETVAPYPPGIPIICAGERITAEVIEILKYIRDNEILCQGLADQNKQSVKVING